MSNGDPTASRIPAPGDVIADKYVVETQIGQGGMGIVLRARHQTLGHQVAIKVLTPGAAKQMHAGERFLREARSTIHLRSEHIARVIDVGTLPNDAPYMVIEFLEGRDLDVVLSHGALSIEVAVDYTLQAAEALAEAHAAGIVHRDLKPANLFLTKRADGSALIKVLDFGIAKAVSPGQRGITNTQAVMGSPGYMSPEQIQNAKQVDSRADVWGLGVILYESLTARPAFDGDNIATLSVQIATQVPKRVDELRPELPASLGSVVARCLEKAPENRYQSIFELANALKPFAPARALGLVDRIQRMSGDAALGDTFRASYPAAEPVLPGAETISAWGAAGTGSRPSKFFWWGGSIALLVLIGAAFALSRAMTVAAPAGGSMVPGSGSVVEHQSSARGIARTPSAAPPSTVAPTGSASVPLASAEPVAPPAPDPSTQAVPPKRAQAKVVPRSARRTGAVSKTPDPKCPQGQSLSEGHCCPPGTTWQDTRCDRPLAISLP